MKKTIRARFATWLFVVACVVASAIAFAKKPLPTPSPLPPGADPDRGPSTVIFPPQSIPLKFDHKLHVRDLGQTCTSCHPGGTMSARSADVILPKGVTYTHLSAEEVAVHAAPKN